MPASTRDAAQAGAQAAALLEPLTALVAAAAAAVSAMPYTSVERRTKSDSSAVTAADEASEAVILQGLARLAPDIPIISEERMAVSDPPVIGDCFFMVDPLDGTREFLAGRDEYAINLALISGGQPLLGIIAAPARNLLWRGITATGAQRLALDRGTARDPQPVRTRAWPPNGAIAAVSRSHFESATETFLARIAVTQRMATGSALKFCLIAEGAADIYPRLSETSEWDIAAGHALVLAAGGTVTSPRGGRLDYGDVKQKFRVPGFIAWGDPARAAPAQD